jgi:hypothetical protein
LRAERATAEPEAPEPAAIEEPEFDESAAADLVAQLAAGGTLSFDPDSDDDDLLPGGASTAADAGEGAPADKPSAPAGDDSAPVESPATPAAAAKADDKGVEAKDDEARAADQEPAEPKQADAEGTASA